MKPASKVALLKLLEALARTANVAASPEAAMRICLERISEYANWDFGRVAILKADSGAPVIESSLWLTADQERYGNFMRTSESFDYSQFPGRFISVALHEKRPVWIEDFGKLDTRGRLRDAVKAGLRSGFAFPIIVQSEVAAFLEFFAGTPRKANPLLLDAVGSVGAQLAHLIERERAEAVRAQLAAIVENSHDAIVSRALDGTVLSWNAGAERMFGYTAAEISGRNVSIIMPPELVHELKSNTEILLRDELVPSFETVRLAKDGRAVQVQTSVSPIRDKSGKVTAVAAIMRDITERKRIEAERAQLAAIVEASHDAIVSRSFDGTVISWNAGAERMFGYTAAEVLGRDPSFLVPDDLRQELSQRRARALEGKVAPPHDTERLTKDGRRVPVSISASMFRDDAGKLSGVAMIFRDISERKEAEEKILHLAHYDNLTGLPNRSLFYDQLEQAIAFARRERHMAALLYIDLDGFKAVNDTLGHEAGDELLKAVAEKMKSCLRASDTIARVGGDEFIAILPKIVNRQDCAAVAKKLLEALSLPFRLVNAQREAVIGASIGIATYPPDAEDMQSLVNAADSAMYSAKQTGNQFRFHEKQPQP